ncbi:MAG: carbohydrate kinase [Firmicutes bacterium]|jgi:sugar (pentulose or hexulose) kinase|nr:carbohydrate kinase [Bacillota bacterium]
MAKGKYIMGIDAGTSVTKAVLFDLDGREIKSHGIPTKILSPAFNWVEVDMNELWEWVRTCIRTLAQSVEPGSIIGIGITAQGDGTWMIDRNGESVRPGICWCDGRASEEIATWHADGTADAAFEICGTSVFTGSQSAQVRWLEKHEPESLQRAQVIFHCKDWLFYKLTGVTSTDETDESLPLLNMSTRQYDRRLFELYGIQKYMDKYPEVRPCPQNFAEIRPEVARDLGLSGDVVVASGPMDVSACALGVGAIENGQACTIMGTAAIHEVVMDSPLLEPKMMGMTLCHCDESRWIRLMAAMAGTPNLEWFFREMGGQIVSDARNAGHDVYDHAAAIIDSVPVGSEGVVFHPYLFPGGERAPFVKPSARASFTGISLNHGNHHLLRAVYEGIAMAMLDCYKHMPIPVAEVNLCGGGAKSRAWCQIFADALGADVVITEGEELGALGAAINCGVATGVYPSFSEAVKRTVRTARRHHPDPEKKPLYEGLYELYRLTYKQLWDTWDLRARLTSGEA